MNVESQEREVSVKLRTLRIENFRGIQALDLELGDVTVLIGENNAGKTTVHISIYNESLERLERMIELGFREGTIAQLENLEELLASLSK